MNPPSTTRWKQALRSVIHPAREKQRRDAELAATLRTMCQELVADLPLHARISITARIEISTRRNDVWSLRACLFDAISMQHGERVARERLASLDSRRP